MSQLGTLWFGADIDLTALKQKIQNGNQSVLDALKMNYDPASYQQMVSKLKSELAKETFEIKVATNTASIQKGLQNTLHSLSNSATPPNIDLSGLKGIPGMTRDILEMRDSIFMLNRSVQTLRQQWIATAKAYGENSKQALYAKKQYQDANTALQTMRVNMSGMTRDRGLASLAQSEFNKQMREASNAAKQWNSDHMRLNATLAGGIHISTQLGSALSSLFALDYARQFLGYVIEIGGQLEKQRISIGAILGDTVKANHLFEQIKGLALKSPFGVVELDQYTKQLSAYGFKYNELYDMTKRLADISAGAGTDIGRLTLALGHVRSATYLTGITLRQFSMNNIPMLKMLADYYTEVEKKAVSTAEVQQRISKRQVSYEDVIEQIRRLTNEGGMFYNMQEKISESLAARYKNLKDAMDIMYGEMAEGTVGDMLKGLADILLKATRHWKEIANVMGVAATAFMLGKLRIGLNTVAMQGNTAATVKQILSNKQLAANNLMAASTYRTLTAQERIAIMSSNSLTVSDIKQAMAVKQLTKEDVLRLVALKELKIAQAMHLVGINGITKAEIRAAAATGKWKVAMEGLKMSIKNTFSGIGLGTWATVGAMVGMELYSAWDQWNQRIDDKSNEMKDLIKSRIIDLQKMQKQIKDNGKPTDNTALKGVIDEMKQVLANSEAYTKTIDEQLSKTSDLSAQYDTLAEAIQNAADKNRQMLDYQDNAAKMIKASKGDFTWWDILKAGILSPSSFKNIYNQLFDEDIVTNVKDVNDAYRELRSTLESLYEFKEPLKEVIDEIKKSSNVSDDLKSQLENAPFEEQLRILAENGYWEKIKEKIVGTGHQFKITEDEINTITERLKGSLKSVANEWGEVSGNDIPKMFSKLSEIRGEDEKKTRKWCLDNIEDFRLLMDGILDQIGEKEPAVRNALKRMVFYYARFGKLAEGNVSQDVLENTERDLLNFVGASDESLKKFLNYDEQATIKDKTKGDSPTTGDKKDKQLEEAKTKLQEYKAFLSEYKRYRELYSKEKAIDLLEQLFPNLKGHGANLVDNYTSMLDKLIFSEKELTESRKKFNNEVNKTKTDTLFDREKDSMKKNAEAMDEYSKMMQEQWKLYRSLLSKSGGNTSFASLAFNDNGRLWDDVSKKMLETFNLRGQELGVIPIEFRWDMKEQELKDALVNADGQVQTELVKLAQDIQKIIRGNYTKFLEDSAEAYSKSLTNAQKLADIEAQIADKKKQRDGYNGDDSAIKRGYDAQIKVLEKERDTLKIKQQDEAGDILQFYSAVLSMTAAEAEAAGMKIRENLADAFKKGLISAEEYVRVIKKVDTQLEKSREGRNFFDAFRSGGFNGVSKMKLEIADEGFINASNKLKEAQEEQKDAEANLEDAINKLREVIENPDASDEEFNEAHRIASDAEKRKRNADKEVVNAEKGLQVANKNRDAAKKNYAATKSFMNTVSGIAYAIQAMVSAFNDAKQAAAAFGEDLDAGMSDFGQHFMGILEGLNSGLSKLQQGDFVGAISGTVFGSIASIAQKHDATLKEDIAASQRLAKTFQNSMALLEKRLESLMGSINELKITEDDRNKLYEYIGVNNPEQQKAMRNFFTGTDRDFKTAVTAANGLWNETFKGFVSSLDKFVAKTDTDKAVLKAIQSEEYFDAAYANLLIQRDQLKRQLIDEEDMKNKDKDKILDLKQQIAEMEIDIDNFVKDMADKLYGINFKDWASQLSEALVSAWAAGEDGAEAYRKKVSEILKDLGVKMITERFVANALEPIMNDFLKQYESDGGILTEEGMSIIARMYDLADDLNKKTNDFMDGLNEEAKKRGIDIKDETDSSSMSNTIKGITEQTADLLASYINGIRADVSVNRAMVAQYYPQFLSAIGQVSVLSQTQVTLQTQIAANTLRNADAADRIYNLLHGVAPDGNYVRMR